MHGSITQQRFCGREFSAKEVSLIQEVVDTLRSNWLTTGPRTKAFEAQFGEFVGAPGDTSLMLNSCTSALLLALAAHGVGPGDEVIVQAGTYQTPGFYEVTWSGMAEAPIVIRAAEGTRPVIQGDPSQNVINIDGSYFTFSGFEITGGSHGLRLGNVDHATFEGLVIHDVEDVALLQSARARVRRARGTRQRDLQHGPQRYRRGHVHRLQRQCL